MGYSVRPITKTNFMKNRYFVRIFLCLSIWKQNYLVGQKVSQNLKLSSQHISTSLEVIIILMKCQLIKIASQNFTC